MDAYRWLVNGEGGIAFSLSDAVAEARKEAWPDAVVTIEAVQEAADGWELVDTIMEFRFYRGFDND